MNPPIDPGEPRIQLESRDGRPVVVLGGEVGIALAGELRAACVEASDLASDVTLDWGELAHLDAAALQVLIALRERLHAQGRKLRATAPSARLADVLAIAGLAATLVDAEPASAAAGAALSHA